tara:strand:- start:1116 stop:2570 length:1455 start_codon:yes stop_codon:yes gene_type:complete
MSLLIPGTNSIKDTGYDVANSLRFNDDDSDSLTKTFSGDGTSHDIGTVSVWLKRGELAAEQGIFTAGSSNRNFIRIESGGQLTFRSVADSFHLQTTQVFNDSSAWSHIVIAFDTTQGTASNRVKFYHNGSQITSFGTETYPSQNQDIKLGAAELNAIGKDSEQTNPYYDGYMAEFVYIDGQQLAPTSFGEFDEDSPTIWKPKAVSGLTFGTNGFHLDFEDSSALGNDVSGNNNDFTVNNLTSIDQTTDTCTNNFAVMGNAYPLGPNLVLKDGNLTVSSSGSTDTGLYKQSIMPTSGKWYFEIKLISASSSGDNTRMGVANFESVTGIDTIMGDYTGFELSTASADKLFFTDNGSTTENATFYTALSDNDIVRFALDIDNSKLYVGVNANWWNYSSSETGGDPTSGSGYVTDDASWDNAMFNGSPLTAYYGQNGGPQTGEVQFNFGNPPFSISSGNSDAEGFGNFEFAVPSGYYSICTKNLAEYG